MPALNAASTLKGALKSLTEQSFTDHEILIYDDGSSDNTAALIEQAASSDHRIRLVGSKRVGLVQALRHTVARADAEYIARMDADDISHPNRLTEQVAFLDAQSQLALASCLIRCFPDEAVAGGMRRYEQWLNSLTNADEIERDIFIESPLCHPSVLMRRQAFELAGGYVADGNPEDYGLWLRFVERGLKMAKVQKVLFRWRESPHRLTRSSSRYAPMRFFELKLKHLLKGPLKGKSDICLWGAGKSGKMWSKALKQAGLQVTAFIDVDPNKVGQTIHGTEVISYKKLEQGMPKGFLLIAVGAHHARKQIRRFLKDLGLSDPTNFICVA